MKKIILGIMYIVLGMTLFAEDLDMQQAIDTALTKNYDIQKSKKDIEVKDIEKVKARKQIYPKLTFSTGYTKLNDDLEFLSYKVSDSDYNYTNKLTLQQPVFMGGAIRAAMNSINLNYNISEYQTEQKKREVRMEVIQNYIAIVKLIKNKSILENSLKELNETNKKLEESYTLELIQKKPLLDMKYRISEIKTNIVSVEKDIEIKKLKLKSIMGIDSEKEINIKEIDAPEVNLKSVDINKDIAYAKENKALIKVVKTVKEISRENEKIKFADLLPKVNFKANYELKGYESGSDTSGTWNANLSATVNVFDFGCTMDEYNKSKKETSKREFEENSARDNIEISVKSAYIEMDRLSSIIESKKEALESAMENYRIEKRKSELEMNTLTELLSAENDLRKIETEVVNAKLDLYSAYLRYNDITEKEEIK